MSRNKGSVKAKPKRTDREKLDLFISKVNELQNTRLAKEGVSAEYNIQQRQEQPLEFDLKQPDEADFRDYLMTFRLFISEDEDVFLGRIFNICYRHLTDDAMKQGVVHARQTFGEVKQHNGVHFHMDGRKLTPLQVTDMYLNSKYFHTDLEYQQQLDSMLPFEAGFLRYYFLNFVINTSRIISYMGNGAEHALQEGLLQF